MPADTQFHTIPDTFCTSVAQADPSWQAILQKGLAGLSASSPGYLTELGHDRYLPSGDRLFAAFSQPLESVRYILVGEGPYPRDESATGYCFMDGSVGELWSDTGLSKPVNRATSLRNFMKMLMVSEGLLSPNATGSQAIAHVAKMALATGSGMTRRLDEIQDNLHRHGFLLLNASLVYRSHVRAAIESRAWLPFLEIVLDALSVHASQHHKPLPKLVLWGKIAEKIIGLPSASPFPKAISEHPYNLSFIQNETMQKLFGPMRLLRKAEKAQFTQAAAR